MYDPQHFVDLQDNGGFGDPSSWLSGQDHSSSPAIHRTQSSLSNATAAVAGSAGNVDPVLFNNLVEIVPLVQSLIDRKVSTSFTRRGSMIYTRTPSRESLSKKVTELKGKNAAQSIPTKKRRDQGDKDQSKIAGSYQDGVDSFSVFSSRELPTELEREELMALREQVEDLQKKLLEKDELLKSAEMSNNQMASIHAKFDEIKNQAEQKDSLIKSTQLQLSDAKIKLADKQAALEKLEWEAMTSNGKVEKLQEDLDSIQGEISSFMLLFEGLTKNDSTTFSEDYDVKPCQFDHLPQVDDLDEMEMQKMEMARETYIAAVAAAKEKQDEDSIVAAARARLHLQSFVFRSNDVNSSKGSPNAGIPLAPDEALVH